MQIKNETTNMWEYKVDINAHIANIMRLWKTRLHVLWVSLSKQSVELGQAQPTRAFSSVYICVFYERACVLNGVL